MSLFPNIETSRAPAGGADECRGTGRSCSWQEGLQERSRSATNDPTLQLQRERHPTVPAATEVESAMLPLFLAAVVISPASSGAALDLCKPALARKAGGEIATIKITSSRAKRKGLAMSGRLTAFLGMGPPMPGSASAHHLIRA